MRVTATKSKYGSKEDLKMQIYRYVKYKLESNLSGFKDAMPFSAISTQFKDISDGGLKAIISEMKNDKKLRIVGKMGAWDNIRDSTMFGVVE